MNTNKRCINMYWCLFWVFIWIRVKWDPAIKSILRLLLLFLHFIFLNGFCTLSWIACESVCINNNILLLLPAQDEEKAHEPGIHSHFIGDLGEHLLSAGGAGDHARRAPELRFIIHKLVPVPVSGRCLNCQSEGGKQSKQRVSRI